MATTAPTVRERQRARTTILRKSGSQSISYKFEASPFNVDDADPFNEPCDRERRPYNELLATAQDLLSQLTKVISSLSTEHERASFQSVPAPRPPQGEPTSVVLLNDVPKNTDDAVILPDEVAHDDHPLVCPASPVSSSSPSSSRSPSKAHSPSKERRSLTSQGIEQRSAGLHKEQQSASASHDKGATEPSPRPPPHPPLLLETVSHNHVESFSAATSDEGAEVSEEQSLLIACTAGDDDDVKSLLELGADPNEDFDTFVCIGKEFTGGTPLVCAVLRGRVRLAHTLIDYRAHPDSTYSFIAGAEQIKWCGTALHAAVPGGNLDMIKQLIERNADPHARGTNGATLLWQASYFGQLEIADYLIALGLDLELKAESQDNLALSYSPLHAASNAGHAHIVSLLTKAKANIFVDSGADSQPLDDAIVHGHSDVVQYLVANGADLFRDRSETKRQPSFSPRSFSSESSLTRSNSSKKMRRGSTRDFINICVEQQNKKSSEDKRAQQSLRCIDVVFASENPVLMTAVAIGLKKSAVNLSKLPATDFIRFLLAPGDAPLHIMSAVFRAYPIMFWQADASSKLRRVLMRATFVDGAKRMNIAEGPHRDELVRLFNTKKELPPSMQSFISNVAPRKLQGGMFVPVNFHMCHIPNVHNNLLVLIALANCQQKDIFNDPCCQAILNFAWEREKFDAKFSMVMAFVEVINLVLINVILNEYATQPWSPYALGIANVLALIVLILVIFRKAIEIIGHLSRGAGTGSLSFWLFDGTVILLTGVVVLLTWRLGLESRANPGYNVALGILVFIKWMRLLMSLRLIESIGMRILPITTTMWDVGPFTSVLAVYFLGSVNMYYALGLQDVPRSFLIIYRMVVLQDADLHEMERVWESHMEITNTSDGRTIVEQSSPPRTEYYYVVRAMMLFISFVMGLSMMNLFIAVLCLSYARATETARRSFMKSRVLAMIDQYAYRSGLQALTSRCMKLMRRGKRTENQAWDLDMHADEEEEEASYLWLSIQKS